MWSREGRESECLREMEQDALVIGFPFCWGQIGQEMSCPVMILQCLSGNRGLRPFLEDICQNLESLWLSFLTLCSGSWLRKNDRTSEGDSWGTEQKHRETPVNSSRMCLSQERWASPSRTTDITALSRCSYLWEQSGIIWLDIFAQGFRCLNYTNEKQFAGNRGKMRREIKNFHEVKTGSFLRGQNALEEGREESITSGWVFLKIGMTHTQKDVIKTRKTTADVISWSLLPLRHGDCWNFQ